MNTNPKPRVWRQRIERSLAELRAGRFIIVCDDDSRENEGDLIAAAELVTPELVNFAITEARGLLCQAIDQQTARYLRLPLLSRENDSPNSTAFTVSVDHREAGTGISAPARALTIQAIAAASTAAQHRQPDLSRPAADQRVLLRPGHIFPLLAMPGGVLQRDGHTEAAIDLVRLAGLAPSGILCEIVGRDGEMARGAELDEFATRHQLCKVTVAELADYRREVLGHSWSEKDRIASRLQGISLSADTRVDLPCDLGCFQACAIEDACDMGAEHMLIWQGELARLGNTPAANRAPLLRIHSECFTGEVLFSQRCDCRAQLNYALRAIEAEGRGLIIYLRQEGRGIGLRNKLRAYQIQQQQALDTVEANQVLGYDDDLREYSVAIAVLKQLKLDQVRLLTNNPHKIRALEAGGIEVERLPVEVKGTPHNRHYLATKKHKSGHLL